MNARGIPTAAYQVLHLLPVVGYHPIQVWRRGGGFPEVGYPPARSDGAYLGWGTPCMGTPLARSHGGIQGGVHPSQVWWGGYPRWGTPQQGYLPARSDGGYPRQGTPQQGTPQPGLMREVPKLDLAGVPPIWTWPGYPPPPRCEQTENITFSHPSDAVGNKLHKITSPNDSEHFVLNSLTLNKSDTCMVLLRAHSHWPTPIPFVYIVRVQKWATKNIFTIH